MRTGRWSLAGQVFALQPVLGLRPDRPPQNPLPLAATPGGRSG
ncbi:hypothetical protein [Nocardia sp. NBC_00416]